MTFNPPKESKMTATNINIAEFINVLSKIHSTGINLINLDMIQDENHPSMNKLIIHPVKDGEASSSDSRKIQVRNPNVSTDNNDIFDLLNNF